MKIRDAIDAFGLTVEDTDCWSGKVDFAGVTTNFSVTYFCSQWCAWVECEDANIRESHGEFSKITFDEWLGRIERDIENSQEQLFSKDI